MLQLIDTPAKTRAKSSPTALPIDHMRKPSVDVFLHCRSSQKYFPRQNGCDRTNSGATASVLTQVEARDAGCANLPELPTKVTLSCSRNRGIQRKRVPTATVCSKCTDVKLESIHAGCCPKNVAADRTCLEAKAHATQKVYLVLRRYRSSPSEAAPALKK